MAKAKHVFANDKLRIMVGQCFNAGRETYFVEAIELRTADGWQRILSGIKGQEFSTSFGSANADCLETSRDAAGNWLLQLSYKGAEWEAISHIRLSQDEPTILREQTYRFLKSCTCALHPGWTVTYEDNYRYTYPLYAHEEPFAGLPPFRADITWALPFPFNVWHNNEWVALYGVARDRSAGTLDYTPSDEPNMSYLRTYYPDTAEQDAQFYGKPQAPQDRDFLAGDSLTLVEIISAKVLSTGEEPLLEAERIAAGIMLKNPPPDVDLETTADKIARFYEHCELWKPNALGEGCGWFLNMWSYTQRGTPQKEGSGSHGFFDLGWGEGTVAEVIHAIARYWRRTDDNRLLPYIDEMTRNISLFKRSAEPNAPYYDRSDGQQYGDFYLRPLIWTHCLGHIGDQLLLAYLHAPSYPRQNIRDIWLNTASKIGGFFADHQRPDGDLPDIFDAQNQEANHRPHRITARAVVCGLWTRLAKITGNPNYLDRARKLANVIAPDIHQYDYYNQMVDALEGPFELIDGEAAYYALEGLAPLYAETRDIEILALCRKAVAFGVAWTYFFNLPNAFGGIARGGQACRMPDFPLLYPIGPARAVEPFLILYEATGDTFYKKMAYEMVCFISQYQVDAPDKPWHGGILHAIEQYSGLHWGMEKSGQVDMGMTTGNGLAAIEAWLAHLNKQS